MPRCPSPALAGDATSLDREAALKADFNARLAKPIEQSTLVKGLDEILSG